MKKITSILALLLVQNSYALELEGINGVDILAINGKTVKTSFFASNSATELAAGTHQIVVRYSSKFNNDELIESRPAIFTLDLQQDTQINVENVNSHRQAEQAMRKGFTWQVINADTKYNVENSETLVGKGFMPYSNIEGLIATYNKEHNIIIATATEDKIEAVTTVAPTIVGTTPAGSASLAAQAPISTTATATSAGVDLITLYQQATQAQKKAFRLWLLEQDMK